MPIADTLGTSRLNISTNAEIARLIANFYRDKSKSSSGICPLFYRESPPFEPLRVAALKYLTPKTVFLLALASGKRQGESHTWTLDRLLCLGDWDHTQ